MKFRQMKFEEDYQVWDACAKSPNHRWTFNKMEVALRQGLHAGPAGSCPQREGKYVMRPIYNLYGMGVGAEVFEYTHDMHEELINLGVVPPGYFWCEWIDGEHLTIDYRMREGGKWECSSVWKGSHYSDDNLTRFKQWERLNNSVAPEVHNLPVSITAADFGINVEMRGEYAIEVHLRLGNDPFDHLPVGTVIVPIWDDMEPISQAEFLSNLHDDITQYAASGRLSDVRRGFSVILPE